MAHMEASMRGPQLRTSNAVDGNAYYGDSQNGTPDFGKSPHQPARKSKRLLGRWATQGSGILDPES